MSDPIIEIRNVDFSYNGDPVLQGVNLAIDSLEFASMVGPNGGGKTTLLRLILGLEKPRTGTVKVFGLPPDKMRHRIGYMPQSVHIDETFPVTALEVVLTGRLGAGRWFGRYKRSDRQLAAAALQEVGLSDQAKTRYASLSGGQKQRVLIARTLASSPELLLLDEPTANLDPQAESGFYKLLRSLNKKLTILMVSHDVGFVSSFVERVVCVNRRVTVHPTGEIPQTVAAAFFGPDKRIVLHDHECDCGVEE